MTKGNLFLFITSLLIFCNFSCTESGGFFSGNGKIKTENRKVSNFSKIKSSGSIDIVITAGNNFELKVEDDENLLPHLITEVKEGELTIYYDTDLSIMESHGKVEINVPTLNKISSSGSGNVTINGILKNDTEIQFASSGSGDIEGRVDAPSIDINTTGSGDIKLSGQTKNLTSKTVGSGDIRCANLKSENVEVKVLGSSDVFVFASVSLKVDIAGSGDVTYGGNPASPVITVKGSGEVKKMD